MRHVTQLSRNVRFHRTSCELRRINRVSDREGKKTTEDRKTEVVEIEYEEAAVTVDRSGKACKECVYVYCTIGVRVHAFVCIYDYCFLYEI